MPARVTRPYLYGREWQRVIDENIDVTKFILSRARLD
jgi:hypothetical protein